MTRDLDRRTLLGWSVGGAMGLALPACKKSPEHGSGGGGDTREVVIGYVSPQTGPLAAFAAADAFVIERAVKALDAKSIEVDGKKARFTVKRADSQSNPTKAGEAAQRLISGDKVDLMLVGHTPDTMNPVGAVCEATRTPCLSTAAPIGPWLAGAPYEWTFHFTRGSRARPTSGRFTSSGICPTSSRCSPGCGRRCRPTRWSARCGPMIRMDWRGPTLSPRR